MTYDKHDCDLMCERLAAYLEGDLTPAEQATADEHLVECAQCRELVAELRAISAEAGALPMLTPSRELWSGIEARIAAPVTQLTSAPSMVRRTQRPAWRYAIAAAALIAASAGTTYLVTARRGGTAAPVVSIAQRPTVTRDDSARTVAPATTATTTPTRVAPAPVPPTNATLASSHSRRELSAARVYDSEITMLDSLVHTRRSSLDPKTVAVIEHNLKIINQAITESRAALAKDPHSPLLSNQLDNVLGSKVELLRTVAFLPTQS
jgi:hypothetical protein